MSSFLFLQVHYAVRHHHTITCNMLQHGVSGLLREGGHLSQRAARVPGEEGHGARPCPLGKRTQHLQGPSSSSPTLGQLGLNLVVVVVVVVVVVQ